MTAGPDGPATVTPSSGAGEAVRVWAESGAHLAGPSRSLRSRNHDSPPPNSACNLRRAHRRNFLREPWVFDFASDHRLLGVSELGAFSVSGHVGPPIFRGCWLFYAAPCSPCFPHIWAGHSDSFQAAGVVCIAVMSACP